MKERLYKIVYIFFVLLAATPVHAAFNGPTQPPPLGNVPGVIWNIPAANPNNNQAATEYNVAGASRIGGDFYMSDSKALRIDTVGPATLNVGNWDNGLTSQFLMNVIGDIRTDNSDGAIGRVSAYEYCYQDSNGNPKDCITSWPSGATDVYVNVTGDIMSGALEINVPSAFALKTQAMTPGGNGIISQGANSGGSFEGNSYGVYAQTKIPGSGTAVYGFNGLIGSEFIGTNFGVVASGTDIRSTGGKFVGDWYGVDGTGVLAGVIGKATNEGSGSGVYGYNGKNGGIFKGTTFGVEAIGETAGLYAHDFDSDSYGYVGYNQYGALNNGIIGTYSMGSLYGVGGIDTDTNIMGLVGYNNYSFYGNGDVEVPNNVPSSCTTQAVAAGAGTFQCSNGKFVTGVRKNASNVVDGLVCCEL
jgi:hypothetical protein